MSGSSRRNPGGLLGPLKAKVCPGDLVVMYQGYGSMDPLIVTPGEILNNRHGAFHHEDLVGKQFGSKVTARTSQAKGQRAPGWLHILQPTPDLWSSCVRQRTQIIQPSDQAVILSQLWLRGGSVVLESGTGSGIFTTALARVVAPRGHIHTFEFNEHRATVAAEELKRNGLGETVTVKHRDVCTDGFPDELYGKADAVMLDVPSPWLAIEHAKRALKNGGRICCYSPCIEQVQRNCEALREHGFHSLTTIECRLRKFDVRETDFTLPEYKSYEEMSERYKVYLSRKAAKAAREAAAAQRPQDQTANTKISTQRGTGEESSNVLGKRDRTGAAQSTQDSNSKRNKTASTEKEGSLSSASDDPLVSRQCTARPVPLARGHTAFLSFATL